MYVFLFKKVDEIDSGELLVRFMKAVGEGLYVWPEKDDKAFVPLYDVIKTLKPPCLVARGRYQFLDLVEEGSCDLEREVEVSEWVNSKVVKGTSTVTKKIKVIYLFGERKHTKVKLNIYFFTCQIIRPI